MSFIKKYWLVILLVFLIVLLLFLKLRYTNNEEITQQNNQTSEITKEVTPTITTQIGTGNEDKAKSSENTFTTTEGEVINADDYKSEDLSDTVNVDDLSTLLPYKGKYFRVEKYLKKGYLEVIVKDDDNLSKAKEEVENWLKENNTNSDETQLVYVFE
jgi:Ca2+/Na+ antiporter